MSTRQVSDRNDPIIESRDQLAAPMARGEKPREQWRIGTEPENFVYRTADQRPPSYDDPGGIRHLLLALTRFGWEPVLEGGHVIALSGSAGTRRHRPPGQHEIPVPPPQHSHP